MITVTVRRPGQTALAQPAAHWDSRHPVRLPHCRTGIGRVVGGPFALTGACGYGGPARPRSPGPGPGRSLTRRGAP
eukprot:19413-Hanusia_phi.AAC.2